MRDVANRPRTFFPSQIRAYRQCPERYYHQYIKKQKGVPPFSPALVKGGATHRLIARSIPAYLRSRLIPDDLHTQAADEVATTDYPPDERAHMEQDALDVASWTCSALEMLPRPSRPLLVEKNLFAPVGRGPIQIGARIDLLLEHGDGTIEHIDFKTGKMERDPVQPLISRIVVGNRMKDSDRIKTTTLYVRQRQADSRVLERETSRSDWQLVAAAIREIRSTTDWPPYPGPLCDYCPYKKRDCSAW